MNKHIVLHFSIVLLALVFNGCGSNNKADGNGAIGGESSMSILLEGEVKLDRTRGCQKFFVVHAVDGNGNPIAGLNVDANVIINAKAIGNSSGLISTTTPITFIDSRYNFNDEKVISGDNLIVLPSYDKYNPAYLGNWKVYKAEGATITLLDAAYNLETTDKLNYIVGDESIYVSGYGNAVAHVEKQDSNGTVSTNSDGYAYFDVIYDLALIGYSYAVGAHTTDGYRIGAAVTSTLPDCVVSTDTTDSDSNTTK